MKLKLGTESRRIIVDEWLKKYPKHPTNGLARAIYAQNQQLFPNLDACYDAVRYARGERAGDGFRKNPVAREEIPDTLPKSKAAAWTPEIVPVEVCQRSLILSDIHLPYQDDEALALSLQFADKFKPTLIHLNGDMVDFYGISRYETDPKQRSLKDELDQTKQFLKHLRKRYPRATIIFKLGNHDERWMHYLWRKAPELVDVEETKIEALLHLEEYGIEIVQDQRIVMLGKLPVLHGHELPKGMTSPVNPARGFFMRGMDTMLAGHLHRTSEHTEPTMMGRNVTTWSTGCLCDLHPEYARVNKWNHGFATCEVAKDGNFGLDNLRILKGKVL